MKKVEFTFYFLVQGDLLVRLSEADRNLSTFFLGLLAFRLLFYHYQAFLHLIYPEEFVLSNRSSKDLFYQVSKDDSNLSLEITSNVIFYLQIEPDSFSL